MIALPQEYKLYLTSFYFELVLYLQSVIVRMSLSLKIAYLSFSSIDLLESSPVSSMPNIFHGYLYICFHILFLLPKPQITLSLGETSPSEVLVMAPTIPKNISSLPLPSAAKSKQYMAQTLLLPPNCFLIHFKSFNNALFSNFLSHFSPLPPPRGLQSHFHT